MVTVTAIDVGADNDVNQQHTNKDPSALPLLPNATNVGDLLAKIYRIKIQEKVFCCYEKEIIILYNYYVDGRWFAILRKR